MRDLQTEIENYCPLKYPSKRLLIVPVVGSSDEQYFLFLLIVSIKPLKVSYLEDSPLVHGQVYEHSPEIEETLPTLLNYM